MVPPAEFRSYYGRPVLKPPTWKVPDVPGYLYLGGLAGSSAAMGALADATGRPALRRVARLAAAGGALGSVAALVHDLGRPARFLTMLRMVKPTSPLSIGSWILAPFSALAGTAAASELTGRLPGVGRAAGAASAVLGPAMSTYTAVLLADTAVPAWHEAHRDLPFVFAGSALSSAGAVGLLGAPVGQAGPARRMAVAGAVLELAASRRMEARTGFVGTPYRKGRSGALLRASRLLTGGGALLALLARRDRRAAAAAGAALTLGAVGTRLGVFEAGLASARDPKYVVLPQRDRVNSAAATDGQRPDAGELS